MTTPTFHPLNKKERLGYGCRHHSNIHHSIKYSSNLSNLRHVFPTISREFHQSAPHEHLPFSARRSSDPFPPFRLISAFRSPHDPATGRIPCGERLSRLVARDLGQTFGVAGRFLANTPCARVRNVGARNAELEKGRTLDTDPNPSSTRPGDSARTKALSGVSRTRKRDSGSVRYTRQVPRHQPEPILCRRRYHVGWQSGLI